VLPLAIASYLVPGLFHHMNAKGYQSTIMAMAAFLIIGESLAWVSSRNRQAETVDIGRMRSMEALVQATVALAAADDPIAAADRVAELSVSLLGGKCSIVMLVDPAGGLRGAGAARWPMPANEVHVRWLDMPARQAMNEGLVTGHPGQPLAGDLTHAAGGQPVVFLPLRGSSQPLGLVMVVMENELDTRLDHFDMGLARTFATQAGLAFERLEATKVLFEASMRDALTGIGNRRQADQSLGRVGPGDAVAILDLDHFKAVNDRYGHPAGDRVLSTLATFLERFLREGDSVARYGGEEFVVILRGVDAQAQSAFDRIAEDWRASGPVTTFSAGVAVHRAGRSPSATLTLADQALYEAKAAGRNRVIMAVDADAEVKAGT
jgi:diguanylate cyclase (GGDEF)-like protein